MALRLHQRGSRCRVSKENPIKRYNMARRTGMSRKTSRSYAKRGCMALVAVAGLTLWGLGKVVGIA